MKRNWYKVRIKYVKDYDGTKKKVNAEYLIDAQSFTETEKKMTKAANEIIETREFEITAISIEVISSLLEDTDKKKEKWYKAVVTLMVEDDKGKIKPVPQNIYVNATDTKEADSLTRNVMSDCSNVWEIKSITETKVRGVLHYDSK